MKYRADMGHAALFRGFWCVVFGGCFFGLISPTGAWLISGALTGFAFAMWWAHRVYVIVGDDVVIDQGLLYRRQFNIDDIEATHYADAFWASGFLWLKGGGFGSNKRLRPTTVMVMKKSTAHRVLDDIDRRIAERAS